MIPPLFNFFRGRPSTDFVEAVEVREPLPRHRGVERTLLIGWMVLGLKSLFAFWAHARYGLPFHPGWLVWPSVAFGLLCTGVYLWRLRR